MKERLRVSFEFVESLTDESLKESDDEEAKKPVTCKVCLINTPKVVFTSCYHCACIICAKRLNKCHICRKKILKKKEIFLG